MYLLCVVFIILIYIFIVYKSQETIRIFGIYILPGKFYYIKYFLILSVLKIRKLQRKKTNDKKNQQGYKNTGYGIKSFVSPSKMDLPQILSDDPKAVDAVYVNGANRSGWHLVAGLARRPHGVVNGFIYLKVPGVGLLQSPKLPDTLLFQSPSPDISFSAEGLSFTPVQAMNVWKLHYHGIMRLFHDKKRKFHVRLDATWKSNGKIFDFDTDMSIVGLSKALSLEPWSHSYFKRLREYHQTHYEQHGELSGSVDIDGVDFDFQMNCMRDHSYGTKREWKIFHRYALHIFTLEDGTRGNIGIVSSPIMFSRLEIGYIYMKDGTLHPVDHIDLELYQHGEGGTPPLDYAFTFYAGGNRYEMKVEVKDSPEFYIGWEWEARIVERFCRYSVNGVNGWGAAEWHYRHLKGRPITYKQNDPQWTSIIIKK